MSIKQIKKDIQSGKVAPIYVFHGDQKYLIDGLIQEIVKATLNEEDMDFNFEKVDSKEQTIESTIGLLETIPFMGDKKVVIVEDAFFLTAARAPAKSVSHDLTSLEGYVKNSADFSILILVTPEEKLDQRKKVVKLLKKESIVCPCTSLKRTQLLPWLQQISRDLEVSLEDNAAQLLVEFIGSDMTALVNEIKKMSSYVGKGGTITIETIQLLTSKTAEQDVFQLVDQVVNFKVGEAFKTLNELLKRKEEPIKILALLARQFRMIYRSKDLYAQGMSSGQMAGKLGCAPFVAQMAVNQSKNFSEHQLEEILNHLINTDFAIKTGRADKVLALEMFLLQVKEFGQRAV